MSRLIRYPKVSVIVLNYNGLRWLNTCLSKLSSTDYPNLDVYLVDNASNDGSVAYVRRNFKWVKIMRNEENLGFAEGFNRAIKKIKDEYIVMLNSDTEVLNKNWIKHLVDTVRDDFKIAAVACKMVSMHDHSRLESVGVMGIPFWRGFVDIGRNELDREQYDHKKFDPFAFCGGASLIKRSHFEKLGGFDEKFFLYVEDVDLSWRLRLSGYRVAFAPKAKVAHYFSGSSITKAVDAQKLYYFHRNLLRAIIKNCGSTLGWALQHYLLYSLMMTASFSILGPKKAISVAKAILWNLINLKDSYVRRLKIQTNRKVDETEILRKIYPKLTRYQPAERVKLRQILDILFEKSQLRRFHNLIYLS